MSIDYCRLCDDDYDCDKHPDPVCPHCMRRIETRQDEDGWTAEMRTKNFVITGAGATENDAFLSLIHAI